MRVFASRRVLLFLGLAAIVVASGRSGSAEGRGPSWKAHHRYKVVDLGTQGGPTSQVNEGGGPRWPSSSVLNSVGRVAAVGETTIPDGFVGGLVVRAFTNTARRADQSWSALRWRDGRVASTVLRVRVAELGILDFRQQDGSRTIREQ